MEVEPGESARGREREVASVRELERRGPAHGEGW